MIEQKDWESIEQVFSVLNQNSKYVILRNYEELATENMLLDGHDDIDFLCENQMEVRKLLGATMNGLPVINDHYYIKVKGKPVKLGIRYVGDGYYDANWERALLEHRVLHEDVFYVINEEDYFYSLLYHALLQKRKLSEEYRLRLRDMAAGLGIELKQTQDYVDVLLEYMRKQNYHIVYPKDTTIPLCFERVKGENIIGHGQWKRRRFLHFPIRIIRYIGIRVRRLYNG